ALMIAAALAALLLPLLRQGRRDGRPRGIFVLALAVTLLLPLGAAAMYLYVGTPVALDGIPRQDDKPANIDQALAELRQHLAVQPDDVQGWVLLAQTEAAMGRMDEAHNAYDKALGADPSNANAMVGWAETDSARRADHLIEGRARQLLEQALRSDPQNQRGLWLLGIAQFQHAQYAQAAASWRQLQPLLQPGSKVAQAVAEQIAAADARAGAPATNSSATTPASASSNVMPASTHGPALTVTIALSPALRSKLAAGDRLYVYARAENGPPMPLAVTRLDARALPATVTLTDAMAMTPQVNLSSASKVFVGARISHSGQPIAQPGDLEGDAGVVAVDRTTPIPITIDKVH
ncbi:MAG: tetratricopeptide repeat protein, partial [Dyella sp.]